MILPLLPVVLCGLAAGEQLDSCKWLTDVGKPAPRPLGGILGRGQDDDGRFLLNSVIEEKFNGCNIDGWLQVVAPDGVRVDALSKYTMHGRDVGVKELNETVEVFRTESHASAYFSLNDWMSINVTFLNSTTTVMPYNISVRTRVSDGQWTYIEKSYRLYIPVDVLELNSEFIADMLALMAMVEFGHDTTQEVVHVHRTYGRKICIGAVVGASGTFTHHSTYNSTLASITLTTEPGRIARSLPSLVGFSVHCAVNQALHVKGLITTVFTSMQWLLIWLMGDEYPTPLPTVIFIASGLWIWTLCMVAEAIASAVTLVTSVVRQRNWWPRLGLRCRHLLITLTLPFMVAALANIVVGMERVVHDPVVRQSVEDFHTNVTHVDVGEFTIITADEFRDIRAREQRQRKAKRIPKNALSSCEPPSRLRKLTQHEAAVVRELSESITSPNRIMQPFRWAHKPADLQEYVAVIQGYGILECEHSIPIYELLTPRHFPRVSQRTLDETRNRLRLFEAHCQGRRGCYRKEDFRFEMRMCTERENGPMLDAEDFTPE